MQGRLRLCIRGDVVRRLHEYVRQQCDQNDDDEVTSETRLLELEFGHIEVVSKTPLGQSWLALFHHRVLTSGVVA